ncbi:MAG: MBG domain-containing protein, partial [Planctomycetia bacterium]
SISTSSSSASLTLSGLVPGGRYVLSMFTVGLENGTRMATLSSAMGQILVNQDEYGNNNGERIDYQYLADAAGSVTINFLNVGSSFHLHGLANREYSPSTLLYAPSNFTYDAAPKSYQASASASNLPFISAGTVHSVILKSDGTVSAFGTNESGQTNVPANLSGVVAVSAGGYHSLALKSDGTVVAWGNNYSGQSNIPAGLNNVVSISAGGGHNLALKSDGTVVAWGSNGYNQCNVPAGLTGVVAISAGDNHSMALKSDGTVVAWGYYFYDHSTPPAGLTDVVAISAGYLHSLALKSDGTVVAWGNLSFQSQVPAGLRGVVAISAGSGHSIALKADGTVVGWGDRDNYGSINIPAGLSGVVAIDAGYEHNIALKSDGTVVTFGWTRFGQQYISNPTGALVQVASGVNHGLGLKADGTVVGWGANYQGQLNIPSGLNGVVAVQAGNNFSVALKSDGTVVAWGYNNFGQCNVPAGLTGVVKIAATDTHVLALKSNGTVVAWGEDYYGMATVPANLSGVIAIATGPNHSLALKSDGTVVAWGYYNYVPAGLTNVKAISSGKNFNVVLKNDGTVEAWGSNDHGQTTLPSGLTGVLAIDCGYDHTVALKSDGSVVSWGYNPWGETTVPNSTQGVGVSSVVAGTSNSYALKSDGTVVGWGLDAFSSSVPTVGLPGRVNPILNTFTYVYEGRNSSVYAATSTPPTNAGDYKVSVTGNASGNITTISQNFTITRFTPSIYYYTQVNSITYGAALSSQQVNSLPVNWRNQGSIVNIPGSVIYSPAIGAVLNVGSHTLQLTFLPADSVNFNPALATSVITVNKATVASANISITAPANLTFDGSPKAFSATSSGVAGFTYSYSGRAGTTYGPSPVAPTYAGNYTVTANVNDPNYQGSKSLDFAIAKAVPTITSNPSASSLIFGQTIASSVLSGGAANVPGTFAFDYTGTQPSAGSSPQTIVFTPTDTVNYQTATGTVFVTVSPLAIAAGAFTFSTPNLLYNGSPKTHSATAVGPWGTLYGMTYSYVGVGGTVYAQSATAPTNAGSYAVTATLTGSNFTGRATKTFTIEKATPSITWANPGAITYGTAISSTQLNATTGVAGSFAYTPALGTVLAAGARTLQTVFTPTDAANYNPVTTTVPLQVNTTSLPITLVSPPGLTYDGIAKNYF